MSQPRVNEAANSDLDMVLAALRRDYSKLGPRIRELQHEVTCECAGVTLRLHFPAFRQGKTTIHELVELAWLHLTPFALTRKEIDGVRALQSTLPFEDFLIKTTQLNDTAAKLFIKAHKATRGGPGCSDSLAGLLSYTRLMLRRQSDGVAVDHRVRG